MKTLSRRSFLKTCSVSFGLSSLSLLPNSCAGLKQKNEDASRPNFILFITDDISFNDLGCYGNEKIKTPNLDKMAAEGVVFDNAYLTVSSCSPSRCSMITGRYPHNTGAPELHTELPMDQFTFPQALREAGYYTALSGKNHMGDVKRAFNKISKGGRPSGSRNWLGILEERPKDKPFFFWFASRDSHRGWQLNELAPTYGPKDVTVPPFLYDGPVTREDLASYYHEVSRTDTYAGKLRAELERQGIADNTYIIYCSDNGRPFPRCKTRLYDSGIKTPLIIWGPKHLRGTRTDSLVSSIDFSATILELAGLKKHPAIQGVSFAAILKDSKATTRDYIFAEHNWHVYQAHERMVRYEKWLYIRNAWPQRQNLCVESASDFPAGEELWDAEAKGRLKAHQRDVFLKPRAAEELYDTSKDPYQFTNLVELKEHRGVLRHLRKAMDQWIEQTGDTIPADPTKDRKYTRGLKPRPARKRGTLPGAKRNATAINHPGPIRKKDVL